MISVKHRVPFAALMAISAAAPVCAETAQCILNIGGQSYIDGLCVFERLSEGGRSFKIMGPGGDYFAYLYVAGDGTATAYWNEVAGVNRAHAPLGELTRDGACWMNDNARLCTTASTEVADLPVSGAWDCEIMAFTLDAETYVVSGRTLEVKGFESIAEDAYGVELSDGYRFSLFDIKPNSLTWHSPISGDTFECRRE